MRYVFLVVDLNTDQSHTAKTLAELEYIINTYLENGLSVEDIGIILQEPEEVENLPE